MPLHPIVHTTHQSPHSHTFLSFIMPDYITLHASAYPPPTWAFLADRRSKPAQTSSNELWTEMTNQYEQSMAKREQVLTSKHLSKTATPNNIRRMSPEVNKGYRQRAEIRFEEAANVGDLPDIAARFVEKVDGLSMSSMETISEEYEVGAIRPRHHIIEKEKLQIKQAIDNYHHYQRLQQTDEIEKSFRQRLEDISSVCHKFICNPVGEPRPRWAQICRIDREVNAHVARITHAQQQLTSDVAQLRDFLRGQLFDEYCLMKETPMEEKDKTWLQYGKCLMKGLENGECKKIIGKGNC